MAETAVRIPRPLAERFFEKVERVPFSGCWLWTASTTQRGYGCFALRRTKQEGAHRVSYRMHKGPIPDGLMVLHRCDVPPCVNPDHLFLGTCRDNAADMIAKGRQIKAQLKGSQCPNAKLTENAVIEIRERHRLGESDEWLASEFGVRQSIINKVRNRRVWTHVTEGAEMERRLYVVVENDGKAIVEKLVRAGSQAQAVSHVVKARFSAEAAKSDDVARLMAAGVTVQEAGAE